MKQLLLLVAAWSLSWGCSPGFYGPDCSCTQDPATIGYSVTCSDGSLVYIGELSPNGAFPSRTGMLEEQLIIDRGHLKMQTSSILRILVGNGSLVVRSGLGLEGLTIGGCLLADGGQLTLSLRNLAALPALSSYPLIQSECQLLLSNRTTLFDAVQTFQGPYSRCRLVTTTLRSVESVEDNIFNSSFWIFADVAVDRDDCRLSVTPPVDVLKYNDTLERHALRMRLNYSTYFSAVFSFNIVGDINFVLSKEWGTAQLEFNAYILSPEDFKDFSSAYTLNSEAPPARYQHSYMSTMGARAEDLLCNGTTYFVVQFADGPWDDTAWLDLRLTVIPQTPKETTGASKGYVALGIGLFLAVLVAVVGVNVWYFRRKRAAYIGAIRQQSLLSQEERELKESDESDTPSM